MKGSVGSVVLGVVEKARKKSFEDGEVGANCLQGFYVTDWKMLQIVPDS